MAKINFLLTCSIPEDQKPINEYIENKENFFLNWTILEKKDYFVKFAKFFLNFFVFVFLFEKKFSLKLLFFSSLFCLFFLAIIFFRWTEIYRRLTETRLFYEEGSWFSIQIWEKSFFLIKNDKLISSQKLKLILRRLFHTFILLSLFLVCLSFFFFF
jgi:hypothetical protein